MKKTTKLHFKNDITTKLHKKIYRNQFKIFTVEKFDKLSLPLLNVGIPNQGILRGIILLIFEKALDEPKCSTTSARFCIFKIYKRKLVLDSF